MKSFRFLLLGLTFILVSCEGDPPKLIPPPVTQTDDYTTTQSAKGHLISISGLYDNINGHQVVNWLWGESMCVSPGKTEKVSCSYTWEVEALPNLPFPPEWVGKTQNVYVEVFYRLVTPKEIPLIHLVGYKLPDVPAKQ